MPIATLTFNDPINSSLQLGDTVRYTPVSTSPNSNISTSNTLQDFGIVNSISADFLSINVVYSAPATPPSLGDYIMFEKNKQVNTSGVKGYYANIKFVNSSNKKATLFSIGSEVSQSSQ